MKPILVAEAIEEMKSPAEMESMDNITLPAKRQKTE